ncbi:MAG: flagellar FlbD family protein [Acidimicrobiia bacterium]|jgi:flagellar protein FlbD
MITLTRLNGPQFALNCDLIERIDATPDTIVTLVDGKRYVVTEPVEVVIDRIRLARSGLIALAQRIGAEAPSARSLQLISGDPED